jgi:hypothetical protein
VGVLNDDFRAPTDEAAAFGEIGELASRWATIEEFHGAVDTGVLRELLRDPVHPATRARDEGRHLYCWTSL